MKLNIHSQVLNELKKILISLLLFGCLVILLLYAIAFMVHKNYIELDNSTWLNYTSIILATLISNVIWINAEQGRMILRTITTGCIMIVLWAIIGMLIFDGLAYIGWGSAIAVAIGTLMSLLLLRLKLTKRTYRKYSSR